VRMAQACPLSLMVAVHEHLAYPLPIALRLASEFSLL
jgi:hypothetical protein